MVHSVKLVSTFCYRQSYLNHYTLLTEHEEGVFRLHEYQHSTQKVFVEDAVLDMVCVVFYAERHQLQHKRQQLSTCIILTQWGITASVAQQGRYTHHLYQTASKGQLYYL